MPTISEKRRRLPDPRKAGRRNERDLLFFHRSAHVGARRSLPRLGSIVRRSSGRERRAALSFRFQRSICCSIFLLMQEERRIVQRRRGNQDLRETLELHRIARRLAQRLHRLFFAEGFHEHLDALQQLRLLLVEDSRLPRGDASPKALDGSLALFILRVQALQQRERLAPGRVRASFLIGGKPLPPVSDRVGLGHVIQRCALFSQGAARSRHSPQALLERLHRRLLRQDFPLDIFEQAAQLVPDAFQLPLGIIQQRVHRLHIHAFLHLVTPKPSNLQNF